MKLAIRSKLSFLANGSSLGRVLPCTVKIIRRTNVHNVGKVGSSSMLKQEVDYSSECCKGLIYYRRILVNHQPVVLFRVFIYSFHLSTCFEHQVLIIRRSNCINTSSGMISLCK